MADVRKLCKIFLDFVYDNNILPEKIVDILKQDNNGDSLWDFRLICNLLRYKESYISKGGGNDDALLRQHLELNADCLRDVNVWQDKTSIGYLTQLCRVANDFFHNVASTDFVFDGILQELIHRAQKANSEEYMARIKNVMNNEHLLAQKMSSVPTIDNNKYITKRTVQTVDTTYGKTGKARDRIPNWAIHPERYNHIIMWAFFKAASIDGENRVTKDFMRALCKQKGMSDEQFRANYASMKTDAGHAHGKVFEEVGPYVYLWDYIKPVALQYKALFLG